MAPRIGIRELREHLSATVRRVEAGETLEVTDRGRPVCRLVPIPSPEDPIARLIAEGRLIPAENPNAPLPPGLPNLSGRTSDELLEEMRRDVDER